MQDDYSIKDNEYEETEELHSEEETKPVRYVDEVFEVVECPHCGHECIWIVTKEGWVLCNAETGSEEPEVHFCPERPDYITAPEDAEEEVEMIRDVLLS